MTWHLIEANWRELRDRLFANWRPTPEDFRASERPDDVLPDNICKRYGIARHECGKRYHEWVREPGALDDWNDRRAI